MYARLVRFSVGAGKRAVAQSVADEAAPLISAQPGCMGVTVFGDDSDGQYGLFVLWSTEAQAEAAAQVVRPKMNELLASHVQGPMDARLFEVISK